MTAPITPEFKGIAATKLADLYAKGYKVDGFAIINPENGSRGFITDAGFVGWWPRSAIADATPSAPPLAADHSDMRVDYTGMLGQVRRELGRSNSFHAEMLRQFQAHLQEMGQRFYAGDIAAVDEFLQLYCVEHEARKALRQGATA